MIHIVPVADLCGAAVSTPIMRNDAKALAEEEKHLRVPVIGAERPAMMEDDGLRTLWAPILVEYLSPVACFNIWHGDFSFGVNGAIQ